MPTIETLTVAIESKTAGFSKGIKVATAGLAGLAAGAAYAFGQFEDSEKVAAQTDAVLKSTGHSANVTAEEIGRLSTALSKKSGIDDEVIQSGENMLLTFKNIKNETGEGNDVFNQASKAALDMAAGMAAASGGAVDMKSTTIQLGKALNDPIAGISALSRVGVTFTEGQKKMIEKMVKAGDTMGAQKLILKELNSEFAGSAKANATSTGKMSVALGNLAEKIGGVVAPVFLFLLDKITSLANVIGKSLGPWIKKLQQWFEGSSQSSQTFHQWIARLADAGRILWGMLKGLVGALVNVGKWLIQSSAPAKLARDVILALVAAFVVYKGVLLAAAAANKVVAITQGIVNAVMALNPIALIIAAVILLAILVVKNWGVIKRVTLQVWGSVKKFILGVWNAIKNSAPFKIIAAIVGVYVKVIIGYFKLLWAVAKVIWNIIKTVAIAVWKVISGAVRTAVGIIKGIINGAKAVIIGAWHLIRDAAVGIWDFIVAAAKGALNIIIGLLNLAIRGINILIRGFNLIPGVPNISEIPSIPTLRKGGIVERTGLAIVHEGERFSGVGKDFGGGGVTVNVYGSVMTERDLADTIHKALLRSKGRSGALGLA